jgi:hypothetical protein
MWMWLTDRAQVQLRGILLREWSKKWRSDQVSPIIPAAQRDMSHFLKSFVAQSKVRPDRLDQATGSKRRARALGTLGCRYLTFRDDRAHDAQGYSC